MMRLSARFIVVSIAVMSISSTIALSCGPFFPWQLINNRKLTLLKMPKGSLDDVPGDFAERISLLIPDDPNAKKRAIHRYEVLAHSDFIDETDSAKECAKTGKAYQEAAQLFHQHKNEEAYRAFLPLMNRGSLTQQLCARYSGARVAPNDEEKQKLFLSLSELVNQGAQDPSGLEASAYGEVAASLLYGSVDRKKDNHLVVLAAPGETQIYIRNLYPGAAEHLRRAVYLYTKQASLDLSGATSVGMVLKGLTDQKNKNARILFHQVIEDPFIQGVLLAYLNTKDYYIQTVEKQHAQYIVDAFISLVQQKKKLAAGSGGELAAFLYEHQQIEKARMIAEYDWQHNKTAMSAWILAKIFLSKGDKEKAQFYYHQALILRQDKTLYDTWQNRMRGEYAIFILSQGSFVQALETLWPARQYYWGDVIYLAEAVLTVDEFKQFVDHHTEFVTQTITEQVKKQDNKAGFVADSYRFANSFQQKVALEKDKKNISYLLRDLLARRLVREKRYKEAIPYFTTIEDRQIVKEYIQALHEMRYGFGQINQAKAAWKAATIMRFLGMEISGTTGYPDFYPGEYEQGYGFPYDSDYDPRDPNDHSTMIEDDVVWASKEEGERLRNSSPIPKLRYHYRYVAVDHALYAAKLVPAHSQAYAAILCKANGWLQNSESGYVQDTSDLNPKDPYAGVSADILDYTMLGQIRAREIYDLYIKNGAIVPFSTHFGQDCPEPDFAAISILQYKLLWQGLRSYIH